MERKSNKEVEGMLLTGCELAEKMRVSRALVSRWTKEGVPCVFIGRITESKRGARPRYSLADVRAWLESRTAGTAGKEVKA